MIPALPFLYVMFVVQLINCVQSAVNRDDNRIYVDSRDSDIPIFIY